MRIVVKVGTFSLLTDDGVLDKSMLANLAKQICILRVQGHEIVLVSSGAVGVGRKLWKDTVKKSRFTDDVLKKQIFASLGQATLIQKYNETLSEHGMLAAQMLLTRNDFRYRRHSVNIGRLLEKMFKKENLLPIVNENDCLSLEELMFSDNDELAGLVASQIGADKLILLTNVNGVYDLSSPDKEVISVITGDDEIEEINLSMKGGGRGGMASKLNTAKKMSKIGISSHIAYAAEPEIITRLVEGEAIGTHIVPLEKKPPIQRWLSMGVHDTRGRITVNAQLAEKLLDPLKHPNVCPSGITHIILPFDEGDIVEITDGEGRKLANGLTRYSSEQLEKCIGQKNMSVLFHYNYIHVNEDA